MENLPLYVSIVFAITVVITIIWFYYASKSLFATAIIAGWTLLQSILGLSGIFQDFKAIPPRIVLLGVFPALLVIASTLLSQKGKTFSSQMDLKTLTWLHTIRIPVELVLAMLFSFGFIPVHMTYEGTNFDIVSGITAPFIALLAFRNNRIHKKLLLAWNIICLLLLLNIVVTAILAFPTPFQQIAFDQPNQAIVYFPFNLLPAVVVPIVLFSHLVAIRQLVKMHD